MKIKTIRQSGSRKFGKSDAQMWHNWKNICSAVFVYHHSHICHDMAQCYPKQ